jgi:hypothetical protein
MKAHRKTAAAFSAGVTLFVLGTAIWTGNSGLFLLAGLSAASTLGFLTYKRRG